ncbi:MAG: type II toxin-antitoxin system Phd/YefM family antitoxin [Phycisphaerales bacterium]|nr:type II toxin-antitoxin system Phd/YefM family antitoxin [Phycisphaerales bacterium]
MKTEDIQPFTEYRARLAELHRKVQKTGRPLFVTKDGRTSAVVLSPEAYDELTERADLAEDIAAIRESLAEYDSGKGRPAREVLKEIAAELGLRLE